MKLEVGKYYKTYGGWKAIVIWDINKFKSLVNWHGQPKYYIIHKPKEDGESAPIAHNSNGAAITTFSVVEPPRYESHHPADLKEIWK